MKLFYEVWFDRWVDSSDDECGWDCDDDLIDPNQVLDVLAAHPQQNLVTMDCYAEGEYGSADEAGEKFFGRGYV